MRIPLRLSLLTAALSITALAFAAPALAAPPSSIRRLRASTTLAPSSSTSMSAAWATTNIDYTLTADATALYACINRGGKNPSAANKQAFEGQVSGGGSFEAKNGRVQASLTTGPLLAPQFTCPSGQRRVLAAVSYTNIVLTDTTNDVSTAVPDASRTFFDV